MTLRPSEDTPSLAAGEEDVGRDLSVLSSQFPSVWGRGVGVCSGCWDSAHTLEPQDASVVVAGMAEVRFLPVPEAGSPGPGASVAGFRWEACFLACGRPPARWALTWPLRCVLKRQREREISGASFFFF